MPYTYKIQALAVGSVIVRSDGAIIPENPDNVDYQEYLNWQAEGNEAELQEPPLIRQWENLSAALYNSSLYQQHLRTATKSAPSQISDRLWWVDKDLTTVLVNWVSDQEVRLQQLVIRLKELVDVLATAGFPITEIHRAEISNALSSTGFGDIVQSIV